MVLYYSSQSGAWVSRINSTGPSLRLNFKLGPYLESLGWPGNWLISGPLTPLPITVPNLSVGSHTIVEKCWTAFLTMNVLLDCMVLKQG